MNTQHVVWRSAACKWLPVLMAFAAGCIQAPDDFKQEALPGQIMQHAYAKASNTGAEDLFGYSMGLSGDTLAVGAPWENSSAARVNGNQNDESTLHSGAAYVFRRTGTSWAQEAYIKPSNTRAEDVFGRSVALSGDTLAVGAPWEDSSATGVNGNQNDSGTPNSGAVYIFRRTGTSWAQEAYIKASNTSVGNGFGWNITLSGDTLAVGSPWEDSSATGVNGNQNDSGTPNSGAVYIFRRTGTSWAQEAYIKASNTGPAHGLGWNVALAGEFLAVGAPGEDSSATGVNGNQNDSSAPDSGAVYIFRRTGTSWAQEAYIKASNTGPGYGFGWTVALADERLAVGSPAEFGGATGINGNQNDTSVPASGAAYVFRHENGSWIQEAYIKASNPDVLDLFGSKVVLAGGTLAVSSINEASSATGIHGIQSDNSTPESGAIYLFHYASGSWAQAAYIKSSNTGTDDNLGYGIALSGNTMAVGAPGEDSGTTGVNGDQHDHSAPFSGAVYIFGI